MHSACQKVPMISENFSQRLRIFMPNCTHLLCVHIYARWTAFYNYVEFSQSWYNDIKKYMTKLIYDIKNTWPPSTLLYFPSWTVNHAVVEWPPNSQQFENGKFYTHTVFYYIIYVFCMFKHSTHVYMCVLIINVINALHGMTRMLPWPWRADAWRSSVTGETVGWYTDWHMPVDFYIQ